jgi:hypothetical protein
MAHKYEGVRDLTNIYQFPLGALMYCIVRLREVLQALNDSKAVEQCNEVEAKIERARTIQYDYEKQKNQDSMRREGAKELDNEIDQTLSSISNVAEEFASVDDGETGRLADELRQDLFPSGVFHITSKSFDEQHLTVDELLERLNGEYDEHVEKLSLRTMVDRLEELNEEFGEVLDPASDHIEYDEVEAAKVEAEEAFNLLVARIMADYGEDMETFNRIMEPVREQSEWARRQYRRRGTVPPVDPESGEPIEQDGDQRGTPRNDGGSSDGDQSDQDGPGRQNDGGSGRPDDDGSGDGTSDGESEEN